VLFRVGETYGPIDWSSDVGEACLKLLVWVLPSLFLVGVVYRLSPRGALDELGLWSNPLGGYLFGLAAALPMLAWAGRGIGRIAETRVAAEVLFGPIAEEVLFRGLLFRQLVRRARRSPVRAMVVSALAFGFAHLAIFDLNSAMFFHLRDDTQFLSAATLVGEATLGGLLFAWLTYRWGSIWPAIGLHSSLNLSWDLTTGTPNPAIITRMASVVVAIALTLIVSPKTNGTPGDIRPESRF
jgi:membrane protease YdiL (CAAX protease family)